MLQFTTPQSGDPQKNKSAIAYQVRQHAAKVAAARQRKLRRPPHADGSHTLPLESCFLLSLDGDTEKSRQVSGEVVQSARERANDSQHSRAHRPKWTSVYRLDMTKRITPNSTEKASPAPAYSPPSTVSSSSEIDVQASDGMGPVAEHVNALPWPGPLESFLDTAFGPAYLAMGSDAVLQDDSTSYHSLLSSGKHLPDVLASLLAFELGSGFRGVDCLPIVLKHAQRRAVGATVALDRELPQTLSRHLPYDEAALSDVPEQQMLMTPLRISERLHGRTIPRRHP